MAKNANILIVYTGIVVVWFLFGFISDNNRLFIKNKVSSYLQSGKWKLEKNQNNIKVYTRKTEDSKIKEFKAITTINTSVSTLINVLNDVEAYPEWIQDVKYTKTLKQITSNERYDYYEISVPWPLDNRDIIVHYKIEQDAQTNIVKAKITGKPDYIPKKSGVVRIEKAKGIWQFTPKENGKVQILYQFLGDPAGNIPAWIINLFIVDGPYKTLTNLKEFVKKEKYINRKVWMQNQK